MKKLFAVLGLLAFSWCVAEDASEPIKSFEEFLAEHEQGYSVPREHWEFMYGYKYDYKSPMCSVAWNVRSASFLTSGVGCEQISAEKMRNDALASIEYVKKLGQYEDFSDYYYQLEEKRKSSFIVTYAVKRDARLIWAEGCHDSMRRKYVDKSKHVNNEKEMIRSFPELKERLVMMLYRNGWKAAERKRGINCSEAAPIIVSDELILNYERW
ncbi:hypothetical protein J7552_03010 [Wohlfahrtiimonas chitiniclastica]|uniref:hypothetical protein n=1 Tax=Wohlfahrtiimonas chitiniclastica TaxID=400946 RepID=UPI001BCF5515|nr:hypothetical protein [Wohlfahrtiimonas chitiniclastica]MBS7820247.1 hypothetical protein [Wohlfahrtiimonas chitiniclastica]